MAELTREQFIQIFGVDPMKGSAPKAQEAGTYVQPTQRVAQGSNSLMDLFDAALDLSLNAAPAALKAVTSGQDPAQAVVDNATNVSRVRQNVAASPIATVASAPAIVDLATKGVPAVVSGVLSDEDKPVVSRIADEFMQRVLTPESVDKLADVQTTALQQFAMQNPDATQKDIAAFHKQFLESDDFYNVMVDQLPAGLRMAVQGQNFANDVSGLGTRADKMTAGDEATQIAAGAFLGLPAATVDRLARPVAKLVGEKVAASIPARVAARTIEAATPLTLPLTAGNVALNAGVGVGINEAIRGFTDQETLLPYADMYNPDKGPDPSQIGAATGISAGILFGLPSVSKQLAEEAAQQTEKAVKYIGQTAGPTLPEQSNALKPELTGARGLIDSNAPVKAAAQKFGATPDTIQELDAFQSAASTANRVETTNNTLNYGILEGMDNTVPFVKIEEAFDQLDDVGKDMLDKYVYAVQRQSNERVYEKSLIQQIEEARGRVLSAQVTDNKQRLNAATKEFTELQAKYREFQQDDPSTRSMMRDWTRLETQEYIKQAEANPQLKQIGDAMRKVSGDLVTFMEKNGLIDTDTAAKWRGARDLHVKVQERPYADKGPLARRALLFKDKFKEVDAGNDGAFFFNTAARNVTGEGAVVNNPLPAVAAIKESIIDTVRSVSVNNTRREIVDRLATLPDANGRLLRAYEFDLGNGRKSTFISQAQYQRLFPRGIADEDKYIKLYRNGKLELWEFGDPMITKAMQFAPVATFPLMNASRKLFQQLTTGMGAPWFAARSFFWDAPVAMTTKQAGRTLGLAETFARRLFSSTSMEAVTRSYFDRFGIAPGAQMLDAWTAAAVGIPTQLGLRAAKAVGDKIAADLATHSGVLGAIAATGPTGQRILQNVGFAMTQAFDQSALAVMSRNMSTSMSHLNDVSKIRNDYASAGMKALGPLKQLFETYKAVLDSVHMSTRYAFFANNYGLLKSKYGADIPQKEIRKLVQETRNLTGDMSRTSLNRKVQLTTSVIPYSNAMLQGTRHVLRSAMPDLAAQGVNVAGGNIIRDVDNRFWSQLLTGVALPTVGALTFLSHWEGAEDYWYNQTPKWKQVSGIPMPKPEVLIEWYKTGKLPQFTPDKLNIVPIAPELSMIMAPVTAGMRALGILGPVPSTTPQPFGAKIKDVVDQITSFGTPPLAAAFFAANGKRLDIHGMLTGQGGLSDIQNGGSGANADMMTTSSHIPQAVYDTIGALLGSSAQLAMQTLNAFDISTQENGDFTKAVADAFDTGKFEVARRMPEVSTPLWNGRQRMYAFTPESEYVFKTERQLEPILGPDRQLSVERDRKNRVQLAEELGFKPPEKLKDPNLIGLSSVIWDNLKKKGPYKQASEQYSYIRNLLKDLENSRVRMPDDAYNNKRNELVKKQQEATRVKSQVLQQLETQITKQIGPKFQQQYGVPFSFSNLSDLVRKDVRGP